MGRGGSKLCDSLWSFNLSNHARVLREKGLPLLNAEDYEFSEMFVRVFRFLANGTGVHSEKILKR